MIFNPIKNFFTPDEQNKIIAAIEKVENETTGEIRVHLQQFCFGNPYRAAMRTFKKLGMEKTKDRTGILFFILPKKHQFVILGDAGIHEKVHQEFWDELRNKLEHHFKQKETLIGILEAITLCGEKLKQYFPHDSHESKAHNELENTISSGNF